MNVQEPGNEAEWITFVSPLVRIVEERGGTSGSSPEKLGTGEGESEDRKGKKAMPAFEMQGDAVEGWENNVDGVQEDRFESLLDFGER